MINLNEKRQAVKGEYISKNDKLLPPGEYLFEVAKAAPNWKEKKHAKLVEKKYGNPTGVEYTNYSTYSAWFSLRCISDDPEFSNVFVFHNVHLHPNMPESFDNFLYAIGISDCSPADLLKEAVGKKLIASVKLSTIIKKDKDKETGEDIEITKEINEVVGVKEAEEVSLDDIDIDV